MTVIDAQVHFNMEMGVDGSLLAMDAVGIDAVLIDEWQGFDTNGHSHPYRFLPNGAFRSEYPMAREAVRRYPGRFAYMAKLDRRDPELTDIIKDVAENPHQLCLRVTVKPAWGEVDALLEGEYDRLFEAAQSCGVPIMLWAPRNLHVLKGIFERFPGLQIILDHCGVLPLADGETLDPDFWFRDLELVAGFENVHIKLSHAPTLSKRPYPFADLIPHVRRMIDLFGHERVMWASDYTQNIYDHSWSEALLYLQSPGLLSETEREWVFAKTAITLLKWPQSPSFGRFRLRAD